MRDRKGAQHCLAKKESSLLLPSEQRPELLACHRPLPFSCCSLLHGEAAGPGAWHGHIGLPTAGGWEASPFLIVQHSAVFAGAGLYDGLPPLWFSLSWASPKQGIRELIEVFQSKPNTSPFRARANLGT